LTEGIADLALAQGQPTPTSGEEISDRSINYYSRSIGGNHPLFEPADVP